MQAFFIVIFLQSALVLAANPDLVQYQHYIPQFILRTFGTGAGQNSIHIFNTTALTYGRVRANRVFGATNLYSQDFLVGDRALEDGLGRLECAVAPVIRRLSFETTEETTTISKAEGFRLKLFLFTLQFRKEARRQFYIDRAFDPLTLAHISDYMAANDIPTFKESWRRDLDTMISMVDGYKINTKRERLYYPVRCEFLSHFTRTLEVWTIPASSERNFIITDASEGLWEGPEFMPARHVYVVGPKTALIMQTSPLVLRGLEILDRYRENTFFPTVPYEPAAVEPVTFRQGHLFLENDHHIIRHRTIDDAAIDSVNFIALNNDFTHGIVTKTAAELQRSFRFLLDQHDAAPDKITMATSALTAIEAQRAAVSNLRSSRKNTYYCQYCDADLTATPLTWPVHLHDHEQTIGRMENKKRRKEIRQRARDRFSRFAAAVLEE